MSDIEHNPSHYRDISRPFQDAHDADRALREFFDLVKAARERCRIADVFVAVQVSTEHLKGGYLEERRGMASAYFGDPAAHKLALLARSYGEAKQEHEEILGDLIQQGRDAVKGRTR